MYTAAQGEPLAHADGSSEDLSVWRIRQFEYCVSIQMTIFTAVGSNAQPSDNFQTSPNLMCFSFFPKHSLKSEIFSNSKQTFFPLPASTSHTRMAESSKWLQKALNYNLVESFVHQISFFSPQFLQVSQNSKAHSRINHFQRRFFKSLEEKFPARSRGSHYFYSRTFLKKYNSHIWFSSQMVVKLDWIKLNSFHFFSLLCPSGIPRGIPSRIIPKFGRKKYM